MRFVVDSASGYIAQQIEYDEFGVVTYDSSPGFQPFGFAGGLYEPETELVSFGAREYAPRFGRWMRKDPYGFPDGGNRYAYAFSDPLNFIDPSGLLGIPNWAHDVASFAGNGLAGVADGVTFGASSWLLRKAGVPIDPCSMAFAMGDFGSGFIPTPTGLLSKAGKALKFLKRRSAARGTASAIRASSAAQGALLRAQLAAEEVAGARLPQAITGYSRHGLNQAISRDGVGVSTRAIRDAFKNPTSIAGQSSGRFVLTGRDAVVVVNAKGKVITTWATNSAGGRGVP